MRRQKLYIQNKIHANLLLNKIKKNGVSLISKVNYQKFISMTAKNLYQSFRDFCQLVFKQCLLQWRHKKDHLHKISGTSSKQKFVGDFGL